MVHSSPRVQQLLEDNIQHHHNKLSQCHNILLVKLVKLDHIISLLFGRSQFCTIYISYYTIPVGVMCNPLLSVHKLQRMFLKESILSSSLSILYIYEPNCLMILIMRLILLILGLCLILPMWSDMVTWKCYSVIKLTNITEAMTSTMEIIVIQIEASII